MVNEGPWEWSRKEKGKGAMEGERGEKRVKRHRSKWEV